MRFLGVLALAACGSVATVDAGVDAGHDAGWDGVCVELRHTWFNFDGATLCDTPGGLRECRSATVDDGGLARWQAVYADAGCVISTEDGCRVLDCSNICGSNGTVHPSLGCCTRFTPGAGAMSCRWSPP